MGASQAQPPLPSPSPGRSPAACPIGGSGSAPAGVQDRLGHRRLEVPLENSERCGHKELGGRGTIKAPPPPTRLLPPVLRPLPPVLRLLPAACCGRGHLRLLGWPVVSYMMPSTRRSRAPSLRCKNFFSGQRGPSPSSSSSPSGSSASPTRPASPSACGERSQVSRLG